MHIVETLIAERAARLISRPILWPLLKWPLYTALGYRRAVAMADHIYPMNGRECFDYAADEIGISIRTTGTNHIPPKGPLIIVSNHPTGLADGLFMYQALKDIRPEHIYLANADALRVMPKGDDIIIPVEWVEDKRTPAKTKLTLTRMKKALAQNQCIIIFPSGRLASKIKGEMVEKPWMSTAAAFARKHNVPIIPVHIDAQNSWLFYAFSKMNTELRDITLFREMLNKGKQTAHLRFGQPVDPQSLTGGAAEATQSLKQYVENLKHQS